MIGYSFHDSPQNRAFAALSKEQSTMIRYPEIGNGSLLRGQVMDDKTRGVSF